MRYLLILALSLTAYGQSTQPTAIFFQPIRNVPMLAAKGINTFCGPEVENGRNLPADQLAIAQAAWIKAVGDVGGKVVLKRPPAVLPAHCSGVMLTVDEPNGKSVLPATIRPESDAYRLAYPGKDIWLSLAGDKILSANFDKPTEAQLYRDYLALADVISINFYNRNRNASRYPDTHTGDIIAKLVKLVPGKRVLPWLENNDQQLPAPPAGQGFNRAPTPAEMQAQADDSRTKGGWGRGWFATCDSGKYGWPASYWPMVDRSGQSMEAQYRMMEVLARQLNPIPPPSTQPTLESRVAELERKMMAISESSK